MRRLALALACLSAASCGDPLGPVPSDGPPEALHYESGGFVAVTRTVDLVGDTVVVRLQGYGPADGPVDVTRRRVPSAEQWRAFWRGVREAGVRSWPRECTNPNVLDGGGFALTLGWGGGARRYAYSNAYPLPGGRCSDDSYAAVERFLDGLAAVADLNYSYDALEGRGGAPTAQPVP